MSYPKDTINFSPNGINIDLPPEDVAEDEWTTGSNVIFRDAITQQAGGLRSRYIPISARVLAVHNLEEAGVNFWLYHGEDSQFVVETVNHTDITFSTGSPLLPALTTTTDPENWSVSQLNGVAIANNRVNPPMFWDNDVSVPWQTMPDWPVASTARTIAGFKFHVFAFGIDETGGNFPEKILWSDAAEPGAIPQEWTPSASNQAGSTIFAEGGDFFQTALTLRGKLLIYKNTSIHEAEFIGGNEIFSFRTLFTSHGAFTPRSVTDIGGMHFCVTDGDIVLTDGNSIQSIANRRVKTFLFGQLDQDTSQQLFVKYYPAEQEVWVCYPVAGSTYCDQAIVWDKNNDKWSAPRAIPQVTDCAIGVIQDGLANSTWDSSVGSWDSQVTLWNQNRFSEGTKSLIFSTPETGSPLPFGSPIGSPAVRVQSFLLQVDGETQDNGVNIAATIGKYTQHFGTPERMKFIRRVHPRFDAADGTEVFVKLGGQAYPTDAIDFTPEVTFTVGTDKFVDITTSAKYNSIEFRTDTDVPWRLTGYVMEYDPRGYH